jgi:hypothetical protein
MGNEFDALRGVLVALALSAVFWGWCAWHLLGAR